MSINKNYIDEIKNIFTNEEEIQNFLEYCKKPLKKSIKVNISKISPKKFINEVKNIGRDLQKINYIKKEDIPEDIFYIDREDLSYPLGKSFFHLSGFFYIQEVAASIPAKLIELKENDLVLDLCASPGGKSSQICDYLMYKNENNPGLVVSNDINKNRIKTLAYNLNRTGSFNSLITKINGFSFGKNLQETFDHVLVDAPCSGEGTGYKSNFALKTWKIEETKKIAGTSFQLLVSAIKATKEGGNIIFSTCTMNPYENEYNIKKVLEQFEGYIELEETPIKGKSYGIQKLGNEKIFEQKEAKKLTRLRPHIHNVGGFFIAKLKKKKSIKDKSTKIDNKLKPQNPFKMDSSKKLQQSVINFLKDNFGINIENQLFVSTNNQVYITSNKLLDIKDLIQFEKVGIPILKNDKNELFKPLHGLGIILGKYASKNFIEMSFENMKKVADKEEIEEYELPENTDKSKNKYVILKYKGYGVGIGKIVDGRLKNKYISI